MESRLRIFITGLLSAVLLGAGISACGGSSGNGGSLTVQGNLSAAAAPAARDGAGPGIGDVTVSALGDSAVTDPDGNFTLSVNPPADGAALFELSGAVNGSVVVSPFPNSSGTTVVELTAKADGSISGEVVSGTNPDPGTPNPDPTPDPGTPEVDPCQNCIDLCVADPASGGDPVLCEGFCTDGIPGLIEPGTCPGGPADPAPEDPAPEDPAPEDPAPEDPAPEDPGTGPSDTCQPCIDACLADPLSGGDEGLCLTVCTDGFPGLVEPGQCP